MQAGAVTHYSPNALYLIMLTYFLFVVLTVSLLADSSSLYDSARLESVYTASCNPAAFCLLIYLTVVSSAALTFLVLKLLFSYNNFIIGYTQSLFFFLFLFLSYFLFLLFTKSLVTNRVISKLAQ